MAPEKEKIKLEGERIILRRARPSDVTQEYLSWMNDKEVAQYLESRFERYTAEKLQRYVKNIASDPLTYFLAIIRKDTQKHIGNIKLGPINARHNVACVGIMIGDRQSWGKGFATEAISLVAQYAFNVLKLHKIYAGAYANNIGSIRSFLKAGFAEEGRQRAHYKYQNSYIDCVLLAKWNE